jgi:glucose/arabinose dehydrogenase
MRGLAALAVACLTAVLLAASDAGAATYFVQQAHPSASDAGACNVPSAPCATIQAAVDRAKATPGNEVVVLPDATGATSEYRQVVDVNGSNPITLTGAGSQAGGTRIIATSGTALTVRTASLVRDLRITSHVSGGRAVATTGASRLERIFADAPYGVAFGGSGSIYDSVLDGMTGARLTNTRIVRCQIVATQDGVMANIGTSQLLSTVVRTGTGTGSGIRVAADGVAATVELRHVTVVGFPTRVYVHGNGFQGSLRATNSTFATNTSTPGTDLLMEGSGAVAKLRAVNLSADRTAFANGATSAQVSQSDLLDLAPRLTPEGRLDAASPLINRGVKGGVLDTDPDATQDLDREPRALQGAADVGADELPAATADTPRWITVGSFAQPIYMTSPRDDRHTLYVVERAGIVRVVRDGTTLPTPFLNISAKVLTEGEAGLLSIAFAKDYATSGKVYAYYAIPDDAATPDNEKGDIRIVEFKRSAADPLVADAASERLVLGIDHPLLKLNHYGGQLQIADDGNLLISVGDGDVGPLPPQDRTKLLGKLLRIDPTEQPGGAPYGIPPDNPYARSGTIRQEIYSYGLRNPFRFSLDRVTQDLIIGDVGQARYEEIDFEPVARGAGSGANFGWNLTEGDVINQTDQPVTAANAPADYAPPAIVRRHIAENNTSITGGYVVRDPGMPQLQGRYLYADYFHGRVRSAQLTPAGAVADAEIPGLAALPNLDSFGEDGCGRLYAASLTGLVRRLATTGECRLGPGECTITGTEASETLTGTAGNDVICGLGGNDTLRGLGGDDVLMGGDGDDTLDGGLGADVLVNDDGTDRASYASRTAGVVVTVGAGADDGEPGEGDDVQAGVERVYGGAGNDRLIGDASAQLLDGGPGADELYGMGGKDFLDGGTGGDVLSGGDGADTADYAVRGARVVVTIGTGADDGAPGEADDVRSDIERVRGGSGDDDLTGSAAADVLVGGAGADRLVGLGGSDTFDGGDGDDNLLAVDGVTDTLACGAGADTIATDAQDIVAADCSP